VPQGVFNAKATGVGMQPAKPRAIVRPPSAALSAFGDRVPPPPPKPERGDVTVRVRDEDVRAVEKALRNDPMPAKSSSPGLERSPAAPPSRPVARKATLVMGAGAARGALPPSRPPLGTGTGPVIAPRMPTVTMGSAELDTSPPVVPPAPPPPLPIETISASADVEPASDPLFVDGKSALGSGEHGAITAAPHDASFEDPTTPELKDPRSAPEPARPPARQPAVPPSRPRTRSGEGKLEPAPVAPVKPEIEDHAGPIGAFAMSAPPPPTAFVAAPRTDPTPLGVISLPPPAAAPAAPASASSGARGAAWILVTLGVVAVLGAGGWAAYLRRDAIMTALGLMPPVPMATALDAGLGAAEVADAGAALVAVTVIERSDAGVAVAIDAWSPPAEDAFVATVVATAPDAWTAPPPASGATAAELITQAAHRPDAEAEPLLRRALELEPTEHHAASQLAAILMRRHQPAEAIPLLEIAVHARPRQAEFGIALGDARRDAGDLAGARQAWQAVLDRDPNNATAQARLEH
jgi:syndecan 1